jgi:hypothetical protein
MEDDSGKQKSKKKFATRDALLEKIENYFESKKHFTQPSSEETSP